jgi:hypothetical protein
MLHPQNVQLHNVQLQNVQLHNVQLQNVHLLNVYGSYRYLFWSCLGDAVLSTASYSI